MSGKKVGLFIAGSMGNLPQRHRCSCHLLKLVEFLIFLIGKVLVNDPVGTVRQIYKHFGYKFEGCFEERMRIWLSANQKNKHGVHRYSLEQFGLEQDLIKSRFAEYCERFMIPPE